MIMKNAVQYKGNDKLLFGIILGVLAFWLFAQTTLNINVDMAKDLGMDTSMMNIAVSITSLFSGIFIVVFGGLADKIGRLKMIRIGFYLSIIGSLLVGLTPYWGSFKFNYDFGTNFSRTIRSSNYAFKFSSR